MRKDRTEEWWAEIEFLGASSYEMGEKRYGWDGRRGRWTVKTLIEDGM